MISIFLKPQIFQLELKNKLNLKNIEETPKIVKIIINRGLGNISKTLLNYNIEEFQLLSGQYPKINRAKKSISNFNIREGMILGISVTLRKKKKKAFLIKFLYLVIPKVRNFQGLKLKNFDFQGNYNYGISDQLVFPEIDYEFLEKNSFQGVNITFVTNTKNSYKGFSLLKELKFPFKFYDKR